MMPRRRTEEEMLADSIRIAKELAYNDVAPPMNRKERRTARGKMLIAMAEAEALKAEVKVLEQHIGIYRDA